MELSITTILIAVTCISSYYGWQNPTFMGKSMFVPYLIQRDKAYQRFVLSGFIHQDGMHLLFNMFTFYFFGQVVERFLIYHMGDVPGAILFVAFYLSAIVISDIPSYFKHRNDPAYRALGASGGTSAAVFSSIILMPLANICLFGIFCLPGFVLGVLFLFYSIYMGRKGGGNISHDAHLYGAVFGIVFILILSPASGYHFVEQVWNYSPF